MDITQKKSEGLIREFDLTLSPQYIAQRKEEKLLEISKTSKLPGFRPGKIPMPILKQRYGSSLDREVLDKAMQDGIQKIIKEHGLRVALQPEVSPSGEYQEDQPLHCKITFEVLPDVQKVDLSQLEFELLKAKVDEERVTDALEELRAHHTNQSEIQDDVTTQNGHIVHLSFFGSVDGKPIQGGASDGMDLELGSGSFIPGFEDELIGLKKGDKKEFDIQFPQDYNSKDLAGKTAHFAIEIKAIKEKKLPELNDDFYKKFDKTSLEDIRQSISKQIADSYHKLTVLDAKRKILDRFAETYKFEVPKGLIDLEVKSILQQLKQEEAQTQSEDNQKEQTLAEEETLAAQYREIAERRVRLGLLLAEIGQEHQVTVSNKELSGAIEVEARKYPGMEQRVFDYYVKNAQAQASLRAPLFENKVIDLILSKAKIIEKDISYTELTKRIEEITQDEEMVEQK